MFDVSWGELLIVGAVALVVIGPKDLPKALRTLGQTTAKLKRMAAEFQNQFNEAMREAELDEIRKQVTSVADATQNLNPIQAIQDQIKGAIEDGTNPADASATAPAGDGKPAEPPPEAALRLAEPPEVPDAQRAIADAAAAAPAEAANVKPLDIAPEKASSDKANSDEANSEKTPAEREQESSPALQSRTNAA
jgi:sec-independent protein translocase protein TatB